MKLDSRGLLERIVLLNEENARLKEEIKSLKKQLKLPFNQFTLDQFVNSYLTNRVTMKTMPKSSGIYAYYNRGEKLLYVGQSVNMNNRLKQHFRNGKIKVSGHDCEFKDKDAWEFYVLEYVPKDDKKQLDDREAYWIAMAKVAVSNKKIVTSEVKSYEKALKDGVKTSDINFVKVLKSDGNITNSTRGNNIKM